MPTYTYECKKCGHILESFQRMSDAPLKDCPKCGEDALKRVLLSAPSFALKGKGWYKTDYASGKTPDKPSKSDDTNTSGESSTS